MNFTFSKHGCLLIAMSMSCATSCLAQDIELGEPISIEQPKTFSSEVSAPVPTLAQSVLPIETGSTPTPPKSIGSLAIQSGERLMPTLKKWLADQNVELVWAANASTAGRVRDVVFDDDFESSSADIAVALTEVLSPFGFEAEISANSSLRRVTVRNLRNNL
jgi:hypothetical protein